MGVGSHSWTTEQKAYEKLQESVTPPKFNMEPEKKSRTRKFLSECIIFRFHVKFRGRKNILPLVLGFFSPPVPRESRY